MNKPILVSSNENKLKEFSRFGLDLAIEKGRDLQEIKSTLLNVVIHKALDAGEGRVVEDTALIIDGEPIVDIKWRLKELAKLSADERPSVFWSVILGYNTGEEIKVYYGSVQCHLAGLTENDVVPEDAFGFDPYLCPAGESYSLYQLEKMGLKDNFSARKIAAENFMGDRYGHVVKVADVEPWTGEYQGQ